MSSPNMRLFHDEDQNGRAVLAPAWSGTGKKEFRQGDAYELIRELPPQSVDLIITSPPYWGQRSYGQEHNWQVHRLWQKAGHEQHESPPYPWYREHGGVLGLEPFPEWYLSHLAEILDAGRVCLRDTGSMWINIGDTYFARWASIRENGRQGLGGHPVSVGEHRWAGTSKKSNCFLFRPVWQFVCRNFGGYFATISSGTSPMFRLDRKEIV